MLRIHDRDRGASFVEYAGVVMVVAALIGVVAFSGVADSAGQQVADGIHEAFGGDPAESAESASSHGDGDASGGGGGTGGGDDGGADEDDGGGSGDEGGDDSGDDGCGWNLICHGGNAAEAVGDGFSAAGGALMTGLEWTGEQAAGLGKGALEAASGAVTGLGELIMDPVGGMEAWIGGFIDDPLSLVGLDQETRDLISEGEYGEALGAGIVGFFGKKIPGKPSGGRGDGNDSGGNNNDNDGNGNNNDNDNYAGPTCSRGNSFVPGTDVLMADGSRVAIETVDVGDEVWAFDPATGEEGPRAVTDLIDSAGEKTLVDVEVTDSAGEASSVTATEGHPFWVPQAGQWVEAAELDPGTWLRTSAGTWTQVTAVDVRTVDDQQTHNLTIADLHTYYVAVGESTALVHNSDCVDPNHVQELKDNGIKFSEENLVTTGRTSDGDVVFLEKGGDKAGLQHIVNDHGDHFAQKGVSESEIPELVTKAATEGRRIGSQGQGRPVYEVDFNGETHRLAVTVGSNGFIVGANPQS